MTNTDRIKALEARAEKAELRLYRLEQTLMNFYVATHPSIRIMDQGKLANVMGKFVDEVLNEDSGVQR